MTPLRQRLIDELDLRGLALLTKRNYVAAVAALAQHYRRPPDRLSDEELKGYLLHLIRVRKLAQSTLNVAVSALRFFYEVVLARPFSAVSDALPRVKRGTRRPQVYSVEEMERLFAARGLNPKHRVLLMTAYAAGLRVGELCRLKPADIHSARMQIRIVQGKGAKDRYTVLSARLLEELRDYGCAKSGSRLTVRPQARQQNRRIRSRKSLPLVPDSQRS
jgi:site-specific recombinase XerD